jgi:hypothetical protein
MFLLRLSGLVTLCLLAVACGAPPAADHEVTTLGTTEVSAQLLEIPGPFPANDLYNYAYVLKYRVVSVHRGQLGGKEILVAHYNPLKARSKAQDEFSGRLGGHLQRFRAGDIHRMALQAPLDQYWMGGVIDKYHKETGTRYWAVWTNLERK